MCLGVQRAVAAGVPVEYRKIGFGWAARPGVSWKATGYFTLETSTRDPERNIEVLDAAGKLIGRVIADHAGEVVRDYAHEVLDDELGITLKVFGYRAGLVERLFDIASEEVTELYRRTTPLAAGTFSLGGTSGSHDRHRGATAF